jgi:hypothetical protein
MTAKRIAKGAVAKKAKKTPSSDWRSKTMSRIQVWIKQVDPEILEDVKWKTPSNPAGALVWYRDGMICTGEICKAHLRLAFAKGPALKELDPKGLINTYRAVVIHEEDKINEAAFKNLIRAAVKLNIKAKGVSKSRA